MTVAQFLARNAQHLMQRESISKPPFYHGMQRTNFAATLSFLSSPQPGCMPKLFPCRVGTPAYYRAVSSELRRSVGTPLTCNVNGVNCIACAANNCLGATGGPGELI